MITIEEFLYLENIVESQARTLIEQYKSLVFQTPNEFRNFFTKEGIVLRKEKIDTKTEKTLLLERFKSFRNSTDYIIAKKYVEDQIRLNKRLKEIREKGGTIEVINNLLNGITGEPIDPFFNFVIRKVLTGSDTGVLPSEELRTILDKLLLSSTIEYYDEESDVERDTNDRIKSFKNLYKNKGRIRVPVLDERFILSDFRYIVNNAFTSLPSAVTAEENVLDKIKKAVDSGDSNATQFLSDLNNLILSDENSIAGLNAKIKELEKQVEIKQSSIDTRIIKEIEHEQFIDSIATENLQKEIEIESKDKAIEELNNTIDVKIKEIEEKLKQI